MVPVGSGLADEAHGIFHAVGLRAVFQQKPPGQPRRADDQIGALRVLRRGGIHRHNSSSPEKRSGSPCLIIHHTPAFVYAGRGALQKFHLEGVGYVFFVKRIAKRDEER